MSTKKVSIIVPAYNSHDTLARCLGSLVHQSLGDIEIIAVNDGSTDDTLEIMERCRQQFSDKVRVIDVGAKKGSTAARDIGIEAAEGEYIGFVNSGDFVVPNMYELLYNKAKEGAFDMVDSAYYRQASDEARILTGDNVTGELDDNKRSILVANGGFLFTRIFKRDLFEGSFIKGQDDGKTLTQLFNKARTLGNVMEVLYYLCTDESSLSWKAERVKRDNREVLFIPYAADRWDGFETLWEEETAKEKTNVMCMPAIWYEKSLKGAITAKHHDMEGFPSEVKVVDAAEYDLEGLHPDVIYVQSISDNNDLSKVVDQAFFIDRLRECTDELIFVPYEMIPEKKLSDDEEFEKMASKIYHSNLFKLDGIIPQTKYMRDLYVRVLNERSGGTSEDKWKEVVRDRISPRIEKIKRLCESEIEIPKDWEKYIYKPDGSRKKVMLYSNSAWTFLEGGIDLFEKIRDSFRVFEKNKDIVALIWRPDPGVREVLELVRKEYLPEYDRLVEDFRQEDIGILDDDPKFDRAVALSDGFYGDDGGMVALYKELGKPIMIENLAVRAGV